jgi:hypothetical protein
VSHVIVLFDFIEESTTRAPRYGAVSMNSR